MAWQRLAVLLLIHMVILASTESSVRQANFQECQTIKNKKMRAICISIVSNPIFDIAEASVPRSPAPDEAAADFGWWSGRGKHGRFAEDIGNLQRARRDTPAAPDKCTDGFGGSELRQKSLSPWEYYINFDNHRMPRYIIAARCLCSGCIDPSTHEEDETLHSKELTTKMKVMTREPSTSLIWHVTRIDLPVGCTCTVP